MCSTWIGIAQSALRRIDDALEGEVVRALADDAQIGQRIADFRALAGSVAADDAIGHAQRHEPVFDLAHLRRDAHENRDLGERMLGVQRLDLFADEAGFILGIPGAGDRHLLARLVFGAQGLAEAALVLGDEADAAERMWPVER